MQTPQKSDSAFAADESNNSTEGPTRVFGKEQQLPGKSKLQPQVPYGNGLQATDGIVVVAVGERSDTADFSSEGPAAHPQPLRCHLLMARVLTAVVGVTCLVTIALCPVGFPFSKEMLKGTEGDDENFRGVILGIMNGVALVESGFCVVAMAACFGLLFTRPHAVLIRSTCNNALNCLCASVFLLFLFAVYTVASCVYTATLFENMALYAVAAAFAGVRCVGLLWFFVLLLVNSKAKPHDPLY